MKNKSEISLQQKLSKQRITISNKCIVSTRSFAARVIRMAENKLLVLPYDSEGVELSETWIPREAVSHVIAYSNEYRGLYM